MHSKRSQANALYQDVYPLSAALSRPLIADLLVKTAHEYGATVVAHGCTGKGNDQVRIEAAACARSIPRSTAVRRCANAALAARRDRVRGRARRSDRAYRREAVLRRRQSLGALDRSRRARRPVERAAGRCLRVDASPRCTAPLGRRDRRLRLTTASPPMDGSGGAALVADAQRAGRTPRRRAHRPDRRSRRRLEIARSLRVSRCDRADHRAPRARAARAHARRDCASRRWPTSATPSWSTTDSGCSRCATRSMRSTRALAPRMTGERARAAASRSRGRRRAGVRRSASIDERLATYGAGDAFDHRAADGFIALPGLPLEAYASSGERRGRRR